MGNSHGHKLRAYMKLKPTKRQQTYWDMFEMSRADRQVIYGDEHNRTDADTRLSEAGARALGSLV